LLEHDYFPLLKLKMWFFVQECAAELPFLSSVKIIFQKFSFFLQILSPIWLGAILCAHAILCAPTVLTASLSFAWTALRAVRILPVLDISTMGVV
jgi:hypothetical protein